MLLTAVDQAGNVTSKAFVVNTEKTKPTIQAVVTKSDGAPYVPGSGTWSNQNVTVTFQGSSISGVKTISVPYTFSSEGSFTWSGALIDHAGLTASMSVGAINIDKTAPETLARLSPAADKNGLVSNTKSVTVRLDAGDKFGGSGVLGITYSAKGDASGGGATIAPTTVGGKSTSFTVNANGTTTVTYQAFDAAGNLEAPQTLVFTLQVDPNAPGNLGAPGPPIRRTLKDASTALQIAVGLIQPTKAQLDPRNFEGDLDVNGDGVITIADALLLLRQVLGL